MNPSPEIEAVLRRYLAARVAGNFDLVRNLFSESEHLQVIGSAEGEWITGHDTVMAIVGAHWETLDIDDSDDANLIAFENGDTGWAAVEGIRTHGETSYTYRATFVFVMEGGTWRIAHAHHAIPVDDEEIGYGVELTGTLSDLLAAIEEDSTAEPDGGTGMDSATIVFTDVVGSTALSATMSESDWSKLITAHLAEVAEIVEAHGGVAVKTLGDGGMYAFPSASPALRAAETIQKGLQRSLLQVRIGIHTGDVIRSNDDYIGLTVAKAARVASAAAGGQILVSASTAGMVNPAEFAFGHPITAELKGLEGTHILQPLLET